MRLYIISDLHLEFAPFEPPAVDCDVVVLAGDTDLKLRGLRWALDKFPNRPVLYVFGNHEFYGEKWPRLIEKGRALVAGTNVQILENETCEIAGWRFFGATLWSDFQVTGDMAQASHAASAVMTDYKKIRHWPSLRKFTPLLARQAHADSLLALRRFMESGDPSRSVVITHHAPSARSLPEKLRTDPVSGSYASNLESLIGKTGPRLWIHGHIHQPSSYLLGNTQVIANPRGYPGELGFNKAFVLDLQP
jgi:Icc-related predicted phosphoesterase